MTATEVQHRPYSAITISKALGVGEATVDRMRKAALTLGFPLGKYSPLSDYRAFLSRYPMFVASDWQGERWKYRLEKYTSRDRPSVPAGISDAQP